MMIDDLQTQALRLPLQERIALIQSLLASIQVETQRLSKLSSPVNDGALRDLSPWVRSLLGVIEDTGESLDDVYVDHLEEKYS